MKKIIISCVCATFILGCETNTKNTELELNYPKTKTVDTVTTYFGTEVKDPYRWLEDDRSSETAAWVKIENELTNGYLESIPYKDSLKNRLETLWNYEKIGAPSSEGDYNYFFKNDGLQNQSVLYRRSEERRVGKECRYRRSSDH